MYGSDAKDAAAQELHQCCGNVDLLVKLYDTQTYTNIKW